jgi:Phosphate-starvation-inducible E family
MGCTSKTPRTSLYCIFFRMDHSKPGAKEINPGPLRDFLRIAELAVYYVLAVMLAITAFGALASASHLLWKALTHWTIASEALRVLDQLLIVLMLVEVLHTVRISIRSHILLLTVEPFLIVGLIASIRRILIISLQTASLTHEAAGSAEGAAIFRASMIELTLLIALVLVLVYSITLLRARSAAPPKDFIESTG